VERAEALGTHVLALTFDPHPKEFLLGTPPPRLTGAVEKRRRLLAAGATEVCALAFDQEMASWSQEYFVQEVLDRRLRARACFVGFNFSFGQGGRGRPGDLERLATQQQIEVEVLEEQTLEGVPVSSTSVRVHVQEGDVRAASELLGEPHRLTGRVVHGHGRGRDLGFPTANLALEPPNLLTPRDGVYVGFAEGPEGERWRAVANLGRRPTFGDDPRPSIEVHLLDADTPDLYERQLVFELWDRLRDEMTFEGPEELSAQITRDVAEARRRLDELEEP
jgi:riboflavin kinase/FMN adenylyltransferase